MNTGANKIALGIALYLVLNTVAYAATPANTPVAPNTLPTGGQVQHGSATITTTTNNNSAVMNVQQDTNRVVINWQSFNVGSQSTVNFRQPSISSIALNRVIANDGMLSQINGHINANGSVILINPNGIMFGNGSQVNVAGLVASTADINISDAEFMAGKSWGYNQSGTTNGNITIQGSIIAESNGRQMDILGIERKKVNTVSVLNNKIVLIADGDIRVQDQINTGTVDNPIMTATNLKLEARTQTTASSGIATAGAEGFEIGSGSSYTAYSKITMRADMNANDSGTVILDNSKASSINTSTINIYYNPNSVPVDAINSPYGKEYNQKDYSNYAAEDANYKNKISYAYTEKLTNENGVNVNNGTWATGKNTYMLVNNVQQLQDIAAPSTGNLAGHYVLGTNIDARDTANWNNGAGFKPIGDSNQAFSGKFMGDAGIATYWIDDLTINSTGDNVGLFGVTKNAALEQIDMSRANIRGNNNVGAVVGTMDGGYIYGSVIYGNVSGNQNVGGLVGNVQNNATAIYNINVANVSGQQNVGGIIGNIENSNIVGNVNYAPVTNIATGNNTGNTGGIVGRMVDSKLSGSQNYDTVTSSDAQNTGGIVGYMSGNSQITDRAVNNGRISGTDNVGGLVGKMDGGKIDTAYNTNEQNTLNTFVNSKDAPKSTYGQVTGTGSNVGGLVGQINAGSINNAYNAANVSGNENVGGIVGSMTGGSISNSYNADNNTVFVDTSVGNINNSNTANYYGFRDINGTQYYYQRVSQATTVSMSDGKPLTLAPGDIIYYTLNNGNREYRYYNDLPSAAERINNVRMAYRDASVSGSNNVGGAVGSMSGGKIDTVYNAGTVTMGTVSNGAVGGLIGSKSGGESTIVRNAFNIATDTTGANKMSGQANAIGQDDNSASSNAQTVTLQDARKLNNGNTVLGTQLSDNGTWSIGQDQTLPLLQRGYMSRAGIRRVVEYNGVVNNLMTDDVANLYGDAEFLAGSGDGRNVYNGDPTSITNPAYSKSTVYKYNSSNIWSPQHGYYLSDNSTLIITPKALNIDVSGNKTYGDNAISGYTYGNTQVGSGDYKVNGSGFVSGESFETLNMSGLAYNGTTGANLQNNQDNNRLNAGNYNMSTGLSGVTANNNNYQVSYSGNLNVGKAALLVTAVTDTKTYDGTRASQASNITVEGLKNSDTASNFTQQYTDKNVAGTGGSTLAVVDSGYNIYKDGNANVDGRSNYTVNYVNASGTINKANISVSGTKGYDGNTATTAGDFQITGGLVGNEQLGLSGNTTLASPNVDYYKNNPNMENWNGIALADGANGGQAGNYNINKAQYSITPKELTITVSGSKTYGDAALTGVTTAPNGAGYTVSGTGFVNNENISVVNVSSIGYKGNSAENFQHDQDSANINAGNYTLAGSGMSGAAAKHGNYNINYADGNLNVNKAALTITAAQDTKTYDGTVSSTANAVVTGLKNSDTVTNLTQQYTDKNVRGADGSTLQVVQSGYNVNKNANNNVDGSGNYIVTFADNTGTINKANISVSGTKGYDGNTATTAGDFQITGGIVGNEQLGLSGNTNLASPNVDYYKNNPNMENWNGIALADGANGGQAGNYNINKAQYSITPKELTINVNASNKYDNTAIDGFAVNNTVVSGSTAYQVTANGLVAGETLTTVTNINSAWDKSGYKFSGDGIQNTNVGTYKYAPSGGVQANHGNYTIQYTGSFEVVPNTFYYVADNKVAMQGLPPGPYSGKIVDAAGNVVTDKMLNNGRGEFISSAVQGSAVGTYYIYGAGTRVDANGKLIWVANNYTIEQALNNDAALRIIPNTAYQNEIITTYGGQAGHLDIGGIRFIHVQDGGINTLMQPKRIIVRPLESGIRVEQADDSN